MTRHCAMKQMLAFNAAWAVLKAPPYRVARRGDDPMTARMRQYVHMNMGSPSIIVRQSAQKVLDYLTAVMGGRDPGPMPEMYDMHDIEELNEEAQGRGFPPAPFYSSVDDPYSTGETEPPFGPMPKARQRRGYGTYPDVSFRDDDDDDAASTPMAKAFRVLIDSHFA